jgi:phospholipase C
MALEDIDTFVVVIMENRSFDHMLGYLNLPGAGRIPLAGLQADPAWSASVANIEGDLHYKPHLLDPTVQTIPDPNHSRGPIDIQINTPAAGGGKMGGFVKSYAEDTTPVPPQPELVMGYYDREAVPVFDFFARNFVTCDHWFASLPAGTQPNRLMAMAGESRIADNASVFLPHQHLVYDWLSEHDVDWCVYQWGDFLPFFSLDAARLPEILTSLTLTPGSGKFRRYPHFAGSWASTGTMPSVIFIEPEYGDGPHNAPNDDHPPTGVAKGQAFLADIYSTLISNPERWAKTMMVVFYDEHGGFFDHVPPIPIPTAIGNVQYGTTGVRVPAFVISPQVASGKVFDRNLDHTAMLQLLDDRFAPGEGYSAAVNARQGSIDRLRNVLEPPAATPRTPQIPHAVVSALSAASAAAPIAPPLGRAPDDPPNARAMHQAVVKAMADHPDLMADPHWATARAYVEGR